MDLVVFDKGELPFVLGALRTVAASDGIISPEESALIEAVARLHDVSIAFQSVEAVTPEQTAAAIRDPHKRKRLVQLAVVAALAAGTPGKEREQAVDALARTLEIPEGGVKVIRDLSHGHTMFARFDVVRRLRGFIRDHDKSLSLAELARFIGIGERPDIAARYEALSECPSDSFGRALHAFYREHGFGFPGEKHGIAESFMFHDVGHVLSGYGVDSEPFDLWKWTDVPLQTLRAELGIPAL